MGLTRFNFGLEDVCDEQGVILDRNTLPDRTSSGGQSAVKEQVTLGSGIQIEACAFVSIATRYRPAGVGYFLLSLVEHDQAEPAFLFQKSMRIGGFGDGNPQRGWVVSHLRKKRNRHRVGPATSLDHDEANNAGDQGAGDVWIGQRLSNLGNATRASATGSV
ncbi:MAG: hypothetical protein JWM21_2391 [Acidobacteria bacterium]|nr:hypothetical protein [Acidobacteriota bacterium]